ncbi:MAG: UDP-glucose 4-epimerase [Actinomycetota bacterium]|nr:UDP-glucose 4-epimerase [Actinomycetota bacterium]
MTVALSPTPQPTQTSPPALTWVIGRGGLLGRSLDKALELSEGGAARESHPGLHVWHPAEPISWLAARAGAVELRQQAREFLDAVGDRPWSVAWCAGSGITGTSANALELELDALGETLDALADAPNRRSGAFFFASSAGGVYAGVGAPPYDESSPVRPLSAYGQAKLDGEALVTAWSRQTGTPALIGRIANIYGPGQNLAKAQGLISQICRSHLTGQPLSIYVSLDTLRDYLFAPDGARLIASGLARLRREENVRQPSAPASVVTKVLASQRAITIGAVLGEMRRIFKSQPRIVLGASAVSAMQARDLSLRSRVWPELDRRSLTPFPVGVATTRADLLRRLQRGAVGGA